MDCLCPVLRAKHSHLYEVKLGGAVADRPGDDAHAAISALKARSLKPSLTIREYRTFGDRMPQRSNPGGYP
jgi:hypothetical protein